MSKKKWHVEGIPFASPQETIPVPIVADGALANELIKARTLIPALLLDTTNRPDIENLIQSHQVLPQGDVTSRWGRTLTKDEGPIVLVLQFKKPNVCTVRLHFDPVRQGGVLDQIIQAQLVYLISARPGDRLTRVLAQKRGFIFVEVPAEEFRDEWDHILTKR